MPTERGELIAELIRRALDRNHWTQRELADHIGVSRSAVSEWKTGNRSPEVAYVERLAEAAGDDVGPLLRRLGYLYGATDIPGAETPTEHDLAVRQLVRSAEGLPVADVELLREIAAVLFHRAEPGKRPGRRPGPRPGARREDV